MTIATALLMTAAQKHYATETTITTTALGTRALETGTGTITGSAISSTIRCCAAQTAWTGTSTAITSWTRDPIRRQELAPGRISRILPKSAALFTTKA